MVELSKLYDAILNGDNKTALAVTKEAISEGTPPMDLITGHMVPAMAEVGHRFETEEYYVPELLLSARAMKAALGVLRPLLVASGTKPVATIVIGTVKGDLHDIGKNLVTSMLEGGGFNVVDLGTDVTPQKFVDAVGSHSANIVALSSLLTVTMPMMKDTIEALKQASLRDRVRVIVGGAPVTREFAEMIGADGYSETATGAVALARQLSTTS
jgi:corrinoid protein of di/trimethylamine methyltransferase